MYVFTCPTKVFNYSWYSAMVEMQLRLIYCIYVPNHLRLTQNAKKALIGLFEINISKRRVHTINYVVNHSFQMQRLADPFRHITFRKLSLEVRHEVGVTRINRVIQHRANISQPVRYQANTVNSLRPDDAYMHEWNRPSSGQIMACRLLGAKSASEPPLVYCQLEPKRYASVKFLSKFKYFHSGKCIWKHPQRKYMDYQKTSSK